MSVNSRVYQTKYDNNGFTLIELLIAMAVASIVMAVMAGAYWAQTKITREQQMVTEMQQNMRTAMYFLQRDFMLAGYDPDPNDGVEATITLAQLDANGNPEIEFTIYADDDGIDNDGDGIVDNNGELDTIHYRLYDGPDQDTLPDDLQRQAGDPQVAGNIEAMEFFYTLADGTQVIEPTDPEDIRAVEIFFLVRTEAETSLKESQTYLSPSGVKNKFNDRFRRQEVSTNIKCRNMVN
jgi:type IV pilus assembly protein PilW